MAGIRILIEKECARPKILNREKHKGKHRKYPKTWRKHYMKDGETLGEMEGNV